MQGVAALLAQPVSGCPQGVGIARPGRSDRSGLSVSLSAHLRPPVSVRIERRDSIRMTVSQTEGWEATIRKASSWTRTVWLPLPAWDSLELALAAAHFWSDTVPEGPGGLDGSRWILEGVRTDRRVLVDHWSPKKSVPTRPSARGQLYPGSRAHPARRARLRAPSNNACS